MNEFAVVAVSCILSSNIVAMGGFGAISLQSEKRNFLFMLVSTLANIVSIISAGLIYYAIDRYVLTALDAGYLKLFIITLLSLVFAYGTRVIIKYSTKEMFFLYEKSYGFAMQVIVTIGTLIIMTYSVRFLLAMFYLAMYCVGYLMIEILFFALYERLDNDKVLKPARNIPLMLYTLAIVGIILSVAQMF